MAFAHVNIADVNKLKESISDAKDVFYNTQDKFYNTLDIATEKVQEGIYEAKELIERCQKSIQALEHKIEGLQGVLAGLHASLAATPPTIIVTTQDEDGNTKTEEHPNPRYQELLSEISSCEAKISAVTSQQEQFKLLQQSINSGKERLDQAIQSFQNSLNAVSDQYARLNSVSEEAVSKLTKIEETLHKYLQEKLAPPKVSIPSFYRREGDNLGVRNGNGGILKSPEMPVAYSSGESLNKGVYTPVFREWLKWKKIKGDHSWYSDLLNTNPNYNSGKPWQENCQRCVPAYEMRCRGYNVTAKSRDVDGEKDRLSIDPFAAWENPDIIQGKGNGREDIEKMMQKWGDGARAEVSVTWKNVPKGHVFVAENRDSSIIFYDPQNMEMDVTANFDVVESGETEFCRIDNLKPSKLILECCQEVE